MKEILKGIIIGIGKIIPGVSGSVLAISLGIYEKAIYSFNNIFKDYRNIYFLLKIFIGVLIAIIFGSKIILYFLNNYYPLTIFAFVGLILGSMNEINKNIKIKYWYMTIVSFLVISILGFLNISNQFTINNNVVISIYYFISGFIEAVSAIVPGISGTALLMLIGSYDKIMFLFSNILDFEVVLDNLIIIITFCIGVLLGLYFSIKLISFLFRKYFYQTYNVILGLLLGSLFIMIKNCIFNLSSVILGVAISIISYIFMKKINHFF